MYGVRKEGGMCVCLPCLPCLLHLRDSSVEGSMQVVSRGYFVSLVN